MNVAYSVEVAPESKSSTVTKVEAAVDMVSRVAKVEAPLEPGGMLEYAPNATRVEVAISASSFQYPGWSHRPS